MAAAIPALLAISVATSVAGGVVASRNASAEAKTLKKVGELEAADRRRETRRLLAEQTVAYASAGVSLGSGSPLDILGDTVAESELAALRVKFGRDSQASSMKREGSLAFLGGIGSAAGTATLAASAKQDTFLTRRGGTKSNTLMSGDFYNE